MLKLIRRLFTAPTATQQGRARRQARLKRAMR